MATASITEIPANWIAYRATVRNRDGSIRAQHTFHHAAGASDLDLRSRAYSIWMPARIGQFMDPTLTVEPVGAGHAEAA
ncbi:MULTISPECIES: hypothetical protein [unclassified Sphingomonas]|uniref:hypothetical protein n=1 Tax=Novosphingobium rhizosphaerae TaxID=1551649 RepID=UPI0015C91E4D